MQSHFSDLVMSVTVAGDPHRGLRLIDVKEPKVDIRVWIRATQVGDVAMTADATADFFKYTFKPFP